MISMNVRSIFCAVVVLALSRHAFCKPASYQVNSEFDVNNRNNLTASNFASFGYYAMKKDDTERIAGGQSANLGQFPFMAVVHRLMGQGMVSQCGGTIISSRWVLTAGHCVQPTPHTYFVVLGIIDKSIIQYDFVLQPAVAMITTQGYLHSDYEPTFNDIGLLYMPQDIPFGDTIQPIRLAGYNGVMESFEGEDAIAVGWGKDGPTGTGTSNLKYTSLSIMSNQQCSQYWAVTSNHVCTTVQYGHNTCQGDSGGPLIVYKNGVPLQVGVVSYGDANCPSGKPDVFTRVTKYVKWIQKLTSSKL
ncbi:PREDICTED: chymotrypsin-2-like [Habropoda laboriosa]|nr:PREDICTED: chymotrypsin-2-like [Habropoda laboriosa]